jgi:hypothetical protein
VKTTKKKSIKKVPKRRGPKGKKTPQLINAILNEFTNSSSISTQSACNKHGLSAREWWEWCEKDDELSQRYARAKERQAEMMAQEIVTIADDSSDDELFTEDGKRITNHEFINRSRLRVDARKWVASKLLPKKYGEKQQVEFPDKDGNPQKIGASFCDTERAARLIYLLELAQKRAVKDKQGIK